MNYLEVKITTEENNYEVLQALLSQLGFDSFVDEEEYFLSYIDQDNFKDLNIDSELNNLKNQFTFDFSSKEMENKNWNEEWEKNFQPVLVGDKCNIRASFHPINADVQDEVIITPKMSFGTGHHATTYMMVNQMYELDLNNKSVLDMGCGTAVLAILAKKKKSAYTLGIDIDDWAVNNSIENCAYNECADIEIIKGDASKLVNYQKFDVILANINRNILLEDIKHYHNSLAENGEILFSGFYEKDNQLIKEEAEKHSLKLIDQNNREDWSMLHFRKIK